MRTLVEMQPINIFPSDAILEERKIHVLELSPQIINLLDGK